MRCSRWKVAVGKQGREGGLEGIHVFWKVRLSDVAILEEHGLAGLKA